MNKHKIYEPNETTAKPILSRRERRAGTPKEPKTNVFEKTTGNNRTLNKARKNNRLFLKMADFHMKIESAKHIGRLKRA